MTIEVNPDPNEIAAKVAVNIITEIFKGSVSGLKKAGKWIFSETAEKNILGKAAGEYFQNFLQNNNKLKILGMCEPVTLEDVYIYVNVLETIPAREYLPGDIDDFFDFTDRDPNIIKSKSIDGLSIVKGGKNVVVLGKPGAGKTTFLKHVGFQYIMAKQKRKKIPIFISLREFSVSKSLDLLKFIIMQFEICRLSSDAVGPFVENILDDGKCILLLDGLDEVNEFVVNIVVDQVVNFYKKYNKNQYIISCRTAAHNYVFENFKDIEVADFEDYQSNLFIKKWFKSHNSDLANQCIQEIQKNSSVKDFSRTPLLLAFLCMNYKENLGFSVNRAETYESGVQVLLKHWDNTRNIRRDEVYQELTPKRKEQLFSIIAWESFSTNIFFMRKNFLVNIVDIFFENLPDITKKKTNFDGGTILKAIESQHGLIVERAYNIFIPSLNITRIFCIPLLHR